MVYEIWSLHPILIFKPPRACNVQLGIQSALLGSLSSRRISEVHYVSRNSTKAKLAQFEDSS